LRKQPGLSFFKHDKKTASKSDILIKTGAHGEFNVSVFMRAD
jgi:hypothetical protein